LVGGVVCSQSISVEKFRCLRNDDSALKSEVRDFNNKVCALLIFETNEKDLEFICRDILKTEQKQGEVWLWVPSGIEMITINHRNLGPLLNYAFPKNIKAGKTYRIELKTDLPQRFNNLAFQEKEEKIPIKEVKTQTNENQPVFKNIKTLKIREENALIAPKCFNRERTKVAYTHTETLDSVLLFDIEKQESIYLGDEFGTYSILFSNDDTKLFTAGIDGVHLFDITNKKLCGMVNGFMASSMSFSKDGSKIIMSTFPSIGYFRVLDANTFKETKNIGSKDLELTNVSFNHDASRIVTVSKDTLILIWDWANEKILFTLEGHSDSIVSVNYSNDGKRIVSGSEDKTIKIWEANTGKLIQTLEGHNKEVVYVEFSPDNNLILSVSCYGNIKIWDANTGACIQTIEEDLGHKGLASFTPDGKRIVAVTDDNFLKIWELQ
jgi:WD40 repeat protein